MLLGGLLMWHGGLVPRNASDVNGDRPRDVLDRFLQQCRESDFEKARQYWTEDSISRIEANSYIQSFNDYCRDLSNLDLDYGWAREGNAENVVLIVAEDKERNQRRFFYFANVDGQWLLEWPYPAAS